MSNTALYSTAAHSQTSDSLDLLDQPVILPIIISTGCVTLAKNQNTDNQKSTTAFQNNLNHHKDQINSLLENFGKPNWDNENADPVKQETVNFALEIVEKILEETGGGFEITPNPHGRVSFDWHLDDGTMFTVSVGPDKVPNIPSLVVSGLKHKYSQNNKDSNLSGTQYYKEGRKDNFSVLECGLKWFMEAQDK
ncbi:MAG: hypothetical protein OXC62_02355 [Aestuariivita sp.]|nr:hypothetical protein [Aestuariivita sp.]